MTSIDSIEPVGLPNPDVRAAWEALGGDSTPWCLSWKGIPVAHSLHFRDEQGRPNLEFAIRGYKGDTPWGAKILDVAQLPPLMTEVREKDQFQGLKALGHAWNKRGPSHRVRWKSPNHIELTAHGRTVAEWDTCSTFHTPMYHVQGMPARVWGESLEAFQAQLDLTFPE